MRYFAKKPKSSALPAGRSWAYRGMLCCGGPCGRGNARPYGLPINAVHLTPHRRGGATAPKNLIFCS